MLDRIKRLLNITLTDTSKDDLLNEIISLYTSSINLYCNTLILPVELEFIVIECSVARYNTLGSEGIKSESIEGASTTYHEEITSIYKGHLDQYKKSASGFRRF